MRVKRAMGIALSMILLVGVFGGCGKRDAEEELPQQQTGGYTASDETLAELPEGCTVKQIFAWDDSLHLLTASEENEVTILREWEQREDGFADVTQAWMAGLELHCGSWVDMQLAQAQSGTQYLFVRFVNEEEVYQGQLWRGEGSQALNITPEKWTVLDEQSGGYESVLGIAALDDGTLAAASFRSVDILDGMDGTVLASEQASANYGESVLTDGKSLYMTITGGSGGIEGIEKRPGGRNESVETISFPKSGMGGAVLCVLRDGTLICAGAEGIFRYNVVTESWDKLLDGSETDFALTTCWCESLAALEDGRVYALFGQQGGGTRLVRYEYDANATKEVNQNLTLYTVWESSLLQQAAAMYHREHPEVLISVEHVYSIEDRYSGTKPDYVQVYQQLNTMLMGEDTPDILVLDYLDIESYAEKGLLADINDVVAPLEDSGELLSNITGTYVQEDGSRYVVPLQFEFSMAIGRDIRVEDMVSLEALAGFLAGQKESYLGPVTADELVDQFYPYFCGEIVKDKKLDRDALGKNLEYLKAIADNSGIISSRAGEESKYTLWDLPTNSKLAFDNGKGFRSIMFPIAVMEYAGGDFTAFENCFIPSLQVGISTKSPYRDTAEDFLRFALSREIQDTDYHTGFSVNRDSLEKQEKEDRSDVIAVTTMVNSAGEEEMFEIGDYSPEIAKKLTDLCKSLDRPAVEDAKIREELIAALPGYLDGSKTLEETLDSIEGALKMYLAE